MLSHLSADDEEVGEFIGLRSLNQNLAIIMDSDKSSSRTPINATKTRVRAEFEKGRGIAWVTKGREIENYVDHGVLQAAVKSVHSENYGAPASSGPYDHSLSYILRGTRRKIEYSVDKVKVAKLASQSAPDFSVMDLQKRVDELVQLIRHANK